MKKLLTILPLCLMTGCAFHRTTETTYDNGLPSDRTTFVGLSVFNRTAVKGLTVGKRTGKETSTLTLSEGSTETQVEAIKATGEALGAGLGAGLKKAIVP